MASVFETLFAVNCNEHTEKKNNLTYLSWAFAWAEVKKAYPEAIYTIYENRDGWNYFTDGKTCWVKTGVTIEGIEHIEYLPVMDYKNNSIAAERVTSFDVNKAIQRSLTKACARHGLGLYIYAGEDLPEAPKTEAQPSTAAKPTGTVAKAVDKLQGAGLKVTPEAPVKTVPVETRAVAQPQPTVQPAQQSKPAARVADPDLVAAILKKIAECGTKTELQFVRQYAGTPEYNEIRVAANQKLQSLKR